MARFINKEDYDVQLRNEIAQVIDETTERTKLVKAEDMAMAQVRNHIAGRCDLNQVFAPHIEGEEDTRDMFVVMIVIDIALYHLWSKEAANRIPQTRTDRYVDALKWLVGVREGEPHALPELKDEDESDIPDFNLWSEHPRESNRF